VRRRWRPRRRRKAKSIESAWWREQAFVVRIAARNVEDAVNYRRRIATLGVELEVEQNGSVGGLQGVQHSAVVGTIIWAGRSVLNESVTASIDDTVGVCQALEDAWARIRHRKGSLPENVAGGNVESAKVRGAVKNFTVLQSIVLRVAVAVGVIEVDAVTSRAEFKAAIAAAWSDLASPVHLAGLSRQAIAVSTLLTNDNCVLTVGCVSSARNKYGRLRKVIVLSKVSRRALDRVGSAEFYSGEEDAA